MLDNKNALIKLLKSDVFNNKLIIVTLLDPQPTPHRIFPCSQSNGN